MKILIILTLLSSSIVYATTCGNNGEKAFLACAEMGMFQDMCEKAVGTNHADEAAVGVCLSVPNVPDNLKYNCIVGTINKSFTQGEILNCMQKQSFRRVDCVTNSGTAFIPSTMLYNNGEEALVACEDTNGFSSYCKRTVGQRHSDLGALAVCKTVPNVLDNIKFACIQGTLDKTFTPAELASCMKKQSFKRVDCISNSGSVILPNSCQ